MYPSKSSTGARRNKNGKHHKQQQGWNLPILRPKKTSILEKTAMAATVATKTASKVATAALWTSPTPNIDTTSCSSNNRNNVNFSHFGDYGASDVSISTRLVSPDSRENSLVLASLRGKKRKSIPDKSSTKQKAGAQADSSDLKRLVDPLIPQSLWDRLTGNEFPEHMELLDDLARMGYKLAANDESNDWVAWTRVSSSFKQGLEDGAIHVWTGRARLRNNDSSSYYGAAAPFIKSRSIVPMSPMEMIDLMLDSSRVKTYNKWSMGRQDLWKSSNERTKIVQNTNKVPVGSKPLRSTTLLHACPVDARMTSKPTTGGSGGDQTAWLLLSRATGPQPEDKNIGTSDILLGVNLIQPLDDGQSVLTAITHVYSTAVPGVLAEKLGVKSAVKFVKDMRGLVVPAA
ncbi:hypothetical protein ACA910_012615 [Epithemia clementina (nom. ined.)]